FDSGEGDGPREAAPAGGDPAARTGKGSTGKASTGKTGTGKANTAEASADATEKARIGLKFTELLAALAKAFGRWPSRAYRDVPFSTQCALSRHGFHGSGCGPNGGLGGQSSGAGSLGRGFGTYGKATDFSAVKQPHSVQMALDGAVLPISKRLVPRQPQL
ncbi:hypothetical protein LCGC14_3087110, partial [marine sediment metagenome]